MQQSTELQISIPCYHQMHPFMYTKQQKSYKVKQKENIELLVDDHEIETIQESSNNLHSPSYQ